MAIGCNIVTFSICLLSGPLTQSITIADGSKGLIAVPEWGLYRRFERKWCSYILGGILVGIAVFVLVGLAIGAPEKALNEHWGPNGFLAGLAAAAACALCSGLGCSCFFPGCCWWDCVNEGPATEDPPTRPFDRRKFYINRFARLLPVYYLTNIISMPQVPGPAAFAAGNDCDESGYWADLAGRLTLTAFGLTSWTGNAVSPPNGVTWTISTMSFFYIVFPDVLPRMQRYTDDQLKFRITAMYWVQAVIFTMVLSLGLEWYFPARCYPPRAFMVFAMGCMAALHRTKDQGGDNGSSHGLFCGCCCCLTCCGHCMPGGSQEVNARRADLCFGIYLGMILIFTMIEFGLGFNKGLRYSGEAWVPVLLLALILAVTRDGRRSLISKFCLTKPMQTLGDVSMTFYMLHLIVWGYLTAAVGSANQWLIPVSLGISLALGYFLTHHFEAPARERIRKLATPQASADSLAEPLAPHLQGSE